MLQRFSGVLERLEESERQRLQRSMGMKMAQLEAELQLLDQLHA